MSNEAAAAVANAPANGAGGDDGAGVGDGGGGGGGMFSSILRMMMIWFVVSTIMQKFGPNAPPSTASTGGSDNTAAKSKGVHANAW